MDVLHKNKGGKMKKLALGLAVFMPLIVLAPVASACGYYVILGCFDRLNSANTKSYNIGGSVIDTSAVSGFNPGYYCVVDGPHSSKRTANQLRQSWRGTVRDAYVKHGCE